MSTRDHSRLSAVTDETIVIDDLVGVALLDAGAGRPIRWANPALASLLGRPGDDLAGDGMDQIIADPDLVAALDDAATHERTVRLAPSSGPIVVQLSPTAAGDQIVVVAHPAHATARAAMFDAVTGLASLALFREHLQLGLHRRARRGDDLAVLAIGARRFAAAWQQQGGTASVLQARMAERIEQVVRDADVLAARRPGSFLLLVVDPRDAVAAATLVSERMIDAFGLPLVLSERLQPLDLAIGIGASSPDDEPDDVIVRADAAHARAAAAGANRYRVEQPATT